MIDCCVCVASDTTEWCLLVVINHIDYCMFVIDHIDYSVFVDAHADCD